MHLVATSTHDVALRGIEPARTNCTYDTRAAYSEALSTWANVDPDTAPSAGVMDLRSLAILELSTYTPTGARENLYVAPSPAPLEPMGFTGKESDEELGMTYFGERWLIPRLGRWASPDPLHVHASGGGEVLNSYHYVSGNLLQARDPLGLDRDPVAVGELAPGEHVLPREGAPIEIVSIREEASTELVYNLEVEGAHTYLVGETGVWVHNTCAGRRPEFRPNPAHRPGSPGFRPNKTVEPGDSAAVFESSVEGPRSFFYGRNAEGDIYRFSPDNAGGVRFSRSTSGASGLRMEDIPISVRRVLGRVR